MHLPVVSFHNRQSDVLCQMFLLLNEELIDLNLDPNLDLDLSPHTFCSELGHKSSNSENLKKSKIKIMIKIEIKIDSFP